MSFSIQDFLPQPIVDFITDVTEWMVDAAAGADTWEQILVMLAGGATPFLESYATSFVGVLVGMPEALAVSAAVVGNVLCMLALTLLAGGARSMTTGNTDPESDKGRRKMGRKRVGKYLDRLGVPGVCLATPLVLPTMFTAPILVGMGASKRGVIGWMITSIVAWGVIFGFFGDWASTTFM